MRSHLSPREIVRVKLDVTKNDAFMRRFAQKPIDFMQGRIVCGTNPSKPPGRRPTNNAPPAISVWASEVLARSCRFHSRYFRRHSVVHRPSRRQAAKNGGPRSRRGSQSSPPHESVHSRLISQWASSVPSLPLGSLQLDSAWGTSCGRHTKTNPPHPRGGRRSAPRFSSWPAHCGPSS